jgi:hypothetical protein
MKFLYLPSCLSQPQLECIRAFAGAAKGEADVYVADHTEDAYRSFFHKALEQPDAHFVGVCCGEKKRLLAPKVECHGVSHEFVQLCNDTCMKDSGFIWNLLKGEDCDGGCKANYQCDEGDGCLAATPTSTVYVGAVIKALATVVQLDDP